MHHEYADVITRFLHNDERLIISEEREMPLVIEANKTKDLKFLQQFLSTHSTQLLADLATYGAILLRGFDVDSVEDFEQTILSIQGLQGIRDAFMSEEGRDHIDGSQYVLHTNAIYKTGGTVYLGGFHSENYYSADVPGYICFCCFQPSLLGGETGLIHTGKIYQNLNPALQEKLEKNNFYVSKWLVSEVAERYQIDPETVEKICAHFDLPVVGKGKDKFVLMYKPSVFLDPITQQKALQINLFELPTLNNEIRKCFMKDYPGKEWFWHRFMWKTPGFITTCLERVYLFLAPLFYAPREAFKTVSTKIATYKATLKKGNLPPFNNTKVATCFSNDEIKELVQLIRSHYSSCLWQKGDILIVDNKQVGHAGMPGAGPRTIRVIICNPIEMNYSYSEPGYILCKTREGESVGHYMAKGNLGTRKKFHAHSLKKEIQPK